MFHHIFFLLFRPLISEPAERNSTTMGHMVGSKCNLKTHVQNVGYPLPYKSGLKNHLFSTTSQLNGNYIFRTKHDIDDRASALTTTSGLLHRVKMTGTMANKRLQTGPPSVPTLSVNSVLYFIARLRRRTPANGTQPNFAKR